MASAYLSRTQTAGTSTRKFTFSAWVKRAGQLGASYSVPLFGSYHDDSNRGALYCYQDQLLTYFKSGGSDQFLLKTDAKFRDVHGWYHFVMAVDTTQSTANDRVKLYVNGEQIAVGDLETNNQPSQNADFATVGVNSRAFEVGRMRYGAGPTNILLDATLAHVHFTDGYVYSASTFGETDTTTGIWKPKTAPSVTYGNNGFFLKFDNSANMGLDSSGQSNNLTTNGTIIQNKDTPSNVFATLNPLENFFGNSTLSNANSTQNQTASSNNYSFIPATLGFSSGKWYWEMKCVSNSSNSDMWYGTGISSNQPGGNAAWLGIYANDYGVYGYAYSTGKAATYTGNSRTDQGTSFATGDIIGVAVDCDNLAMYVHKNGVYMPDASNVTGVPTSGASRTGALFDITDPSSTTKGFYFPAVAYYDARTAVQSVNFGNGYFGTTAVSSAQSPDDGNGIFEYDVPAGYRALCTKSINAEEYS